MRGTYKVINPQDASGLTKSVLFIVYNKDGHVAFA